MSLVLTNISFVIIVSWQADTMRTKQKYRKTCIQKQNSTSHFEKERFDISYKESSNKNKKVSRSKCE